MALHVQDWAELRKRLNAAMSLLPVKSELWRGELAIKVQPIDNSSTLSGLNAMADGFNRQPGHSLDGDLVSFKAVLVRVEAVSPGLAALGSHTVP